MAAESIAGINVHIGADLSELKEKLGQVGSTVQKEISPAKETVKTLSDHFKSAAQNAKTVATKAIQIAQQVASIAGSIGKFAKGALEAAFELNPETAEKLEGVKTAFNDMKLAIGEALLPVIEKFAPALTTAMDSLTGWIKENPEAVENIMLVVGAIAALSSAATLAAPALMLMNIGLAPISGTALAVAAAIGGLVLIIGMLIDKSDELTNHTQATAEGIENMDTASQQLVQNGFSELEIWDNSYTEVFDPETGEYVMARWDEFSGTWVADAGNISTAADTVAEAVEEQNSTMKTTISTAEEVNEVLQNMQTAVEGLGDATSGDLTESLAVVNELLDSDGFKELGQNPVSEETIAGYQALAAALGDANTAISGGEEGTGMAGALTGLPAQFEAVRTAAESLAGYLSTEFVAAIITMLSVVCVTSTDDEGNLNAGGGNTLYNALGSVFGLFMDILVTSRLLAEHWSGEFIAASTAMRDEAGTATGIVQGLGNAAQTAATHFSALTAQIYAAIDAYLALYSVKGGGGGGSGKGVNTDMLKASGGPVYAGSAYIVGEAGPELFVPHTSGYIVPHDELGSAGGQTLNINMGDVYGDGYLKDYVLKLVSGTIRRELRLAA